MKGTSVLHYARTETPAHYLMPFPPMDVCTAFGSVIRSMFATIELTWKNPFLAMEENLLLPKLASGQGKVKELRTT